MIRLALAGAALLGLVAAGLWLHIPGENTVGSDDGLRAFVALLMAAGIVHAAVIWLVRRRPLPRRAVWLVLAVALLMRGATLTHPQFLSSDIFRYVWDGKVQVAGINPYRFLPNAPELAPLRDAAIYPNINRFDYAPTIYPPAAQALFAAVAGIWPSVWGIKAAIAACDLGSIAVLLALLRVLRRPGYEVAIYAWHPLPVWEFAGNGHIDGAALLFVALSVWAAVRLRPGWAGAALAVATLCKLLPLVIAPAIWRRWDWRAPLACAGVIAFGYAAYLKAGWRVLGFLPGYAQEEGLSNGSGFLALRLAEVFGNLPAGASAAYLGCAGLALLGLTLAAVLRTWPTDPGARTQLISGRALVFAAVLTAALSPHYPWYLAWLAWFACLQPWPSIVWLTLTAPLLYLDEQHDTVVWPALVYVPFALLALRDMIRPRRALSLGVA